MRLVPKFVDEPHFFSPQFSAEMKSRILYAAATLVLVAGIQFLAGLGGSPALVLAAGLLLCVLPHALWMLFEQERSTNLDTYLPAILGSVGVLLGGLVRWSAQSSDLIFYDLLAVTIGLIGSGIVITFRLRRQEDLCRLCGRPFQRGYQQCPRCEEFVCGRTRCWSHDYHRCADCERIKRPLLLLEDQDWWAQRLGPQLRNGSCLKCQGDAKHHDLRKCGQCPWAMCTQCWDFENGRCFRCLWIMPLLPEQLRAYLTLNETSAGQ